MVSRSGLFEFSNSGGKQVDITGQCDHGLLELGEHGECVFGEFCPRDLIRAAWLNAIEHINPKTQGGPSGSVG